MANGAYSQSFISNLRPIVVGKFYLQPQNNFKCKQNKHPKEGSSSGSNALVLLTFFYFTFALFLMNFFTIFLAPK